MNYEQLIDQMLSTLRSSTTLSYVDTVEVIESEEEAHSQVFSDYAIFLLQSEPYFTATPKIGNKRDKEFRVDLILCAKAQKALYQRLTAGRQKGIWEMDEDVRSVLRHNTLSGLLDNYPGENLTDSEPLYLAEGVSAIRLQFIGRKVE